MKNLKKILSLVLVLCGVLGMLALTSCGESENTNGGENTDGNNTDYKGYVVTVVDTDNNPVSGVNLMITNQSSAFSSPLTTDENGKANADVTGDGMGVVISSVPSGYIMPAKISGLLNAVFASGSKEVKITLEKEATAVKTTYTITIVDQNGDAVEGVTLQLCYGGQCLPAPATNADGATTLQLADASGVNLKLLTVPSGYTKPEATVNGEYHLAIEDGTTSVTFEITKN